MNIWSGKSLSVYRKGLVLVLVPLAFELIFVTSLFCLLQSAEQQAWQESHRREIITECDHLEKLLYKAGFALFYYRSTRNDQFLTQYDSVVKQLGNHFLILRSLVINDPNSAPSWHSIEAGSSECMRLLALSRSIVEESSSPQVFSLTSQLQHLLKELPDRFEKLVAEQSRFERSDLTAQTTLRQQILVCLGLGILLNIGIALALARYFGGEISQRLAVLVDNAQLLALNKALNQPVGGDDEITRLDTAFHTMAGDLARANEKRREIVMMVSHDLRSPLTSVQIYLESLMRGVYGEVAPAVVDKTVNIELSVSRLVNLINDFLDLERVESGHVDLNYDDTPVKGLFFVATEAVVDLASKASVTIEAHPSDLILYADEERLVQVLVNLITNAIKFSPAGSTIELVATEHANDIELQVKDHGRGIAEADQAAIFEKFKQVTVTDRTKHKGAGLGLSVCKAIVEAHGGQIGVRSEVGKGSTFWLRLPRHTSALETNSGSDRPQSH